MAKRSEGEVPSIELYMYSLNQEFPVGTGHQSFLKRYSELQKDLSGGLVTRASVESQVFRVTELPLPSDWSAQWVSNEWIENHTQAAGIGSRVFDDPMRNAIIREEDFGAILFEPGTDRVFKLNRSGAKLFKLLRDAVNASEEAIAPRAMGGFDAAQVARFVDYLKAAGLWSLK